MIVFRFSCLVAEAIDPNDADNDEHSKVHDEESLDFGATTGKFIIRSIHRFLSVLPRETEQIIQEDLCITPTPKHIIQVSVRFKFISLLTSCHCNMYVFSSRVNELFLGNEPSILDDISVRVRRPKIRNLRGCNLNRK